MDKGYESPFPTGMQPGAINLDNERRVGRVGQREENRGQKRRTTCATYGHLMRSLAKWCFCSQFYGGTMYTIL